MNKRLARPEFIKKEKKKTKLNIIRVKEKRQEFQLELRNRFECLEIREAGIDERSTHLRHNNGSGSR